MFLVSDKLSEDCSFGLDFNTLLGFSPSCKGKKQRKRTPRRVLRLKLKQRKAAKKKNR